MIFANVKGLVIPEGKVSRITDAFGRVLWAVSSTPGGGTDEPGYSGDPSTFPTLINGFGWITNTTSITEIEFKDTYTPTGIEDYAEACSWWDGEEHFTGINGYRIGSKLIIAGNGSGGIAVSADDGIRFSSFTSLTTITGLGYVYTGYMTSTHNMFYDCKYLTSLDLSHFDTSNVSNMKQMFYGCEALTSLDLSSFDTSNVSDMSYMFYNCQNLTNINLSSFDTSNVVEMYSMFDDCPSLTSLDLSNFDTSNVSDMGNMFDGCSSLTSLDLSSFDTSNVSDMGSMFYSCRKLKTIYVSRDKWVIRDDCYADFMFGGCGTSTLTYI